MPGLQGDSTHKPPTAANQSDGGNHASGEQPLNIPHRPINPLDITQINAGILNPIPNANDSAGMMQGRPIDPVTAQAGGDMPPASSSQPPPNVDPAQDVDQKGPVNDISDEKSAPEVNDNNQQHREDGNKPESPVQSPPRPPPCFMKRVDCEDEKTAMREQLEVENAVLRECLRAADANVQALSDDNTALGRELRDAKDEVNNLKQHIERLTNLYNDEKQEFEKELEDCRAARRNAPDLQTTIDNLEHNCEGMRADWYRERIDYHEAKEDAKAYAAQLVEVSSAKENLEEAVEMLEHQLDEGSQKISDLENEVARLALKNTQLESNCACQRLSDAGIEVERSAENARADEKDAQDVSGTETGTTIREIPAEGQETRPTASRQPARKAPSPGHDDDCEDSFTAAAEFLVEQSAGA